MATRKVNDFGEKIGGARKELWASVGLRITDLGAMTPLERAKYARKDYVFPRPNWEKLMAAGESQELLYWKNEMRKFLPTGPLVKASEKENPEKCKAAQEAYVDFCSNYRDAVMGVKTVEEARNFSQTFLIDKGYIVKSQKPWGGESYTRQASAAYCVSDAMFQYGRMSASRFARLKEQAERELFAVPKSRRSYESLKQRMKAVQLDGHFCKAEYDGMSGGVRVRLSANGFSSVYFYDRNNSKLEDYEIGKMIILDVRKNSVVEKNIASEELANAIIEKAAKMAQEKEENSKAEKKESNRKKKFEFEDLGADAWRSGPEYLGRPATEKDFLDELKFRGGEFGNWVSNNERQDNLTAAYNAFRDLARVLNIAPEDVSLNGQLAIAFGARGQGGKSAAAAHYERLRTVINLTRYHGAGCLAHEWGHAFDDYIGKKLNLPIGDMLSDAADQYRYKEVLKAAPKAMVEIIELMKFKETTPTKEEAASAMEEAVALADKSIARWLDSVKPTGMDEQQQEIWKSLCKAFVDGRDALQGGEYFTIRRSSRLLTYAPLEALSDFKKQVTGHVISKQSKFELATALHQYSETVNRPLEEYMRPHLVQTDFYRGSREFDGMFAKESQGYWSSNREMFARAFDTYIEDKLSAAGTSSTFLTSHASKFHRKREDGTMIRAYPVGEERQILNQKFDELIAEAKEMGLFHEPEKEITIQKPESKDKTEDVVLTDESTKAFLNSAPMMAIEPKEMTDAQKEQWYDAASNALTQRTAESFEALSDLRKEFLGRAIPAFNLKKVAAAANSVYEDARRDIYIERQVDKTAAKQPEVEPRQLSFADYSR